MFLDSHDLPAEVHGLVSFFDLTKFLRVAQQRTSRELFGLLADYYEFVDGIIAESNGIVIKFMGDAGLMFHPNTDVEAGILALLRLQKEGDAWLQARNIPSRNIIKAHYGPVMIGYLGGRDDKRLDLLGQTVNTAATLASSGLAISAQAFRQLSSDGRRKFKKYTLPITYIPIAQPHG